MVVRWMNMQGQCSKASQEQTMVISRIPATLLVGLALAAAAQAAPVTVAGVRFDDSADIRGAKVQLNGAGVRFKAVFKVYAAGLYLPRKAATPDDALAMPGAKRIAITMLRDIDSAELGKLFSRGMEDNMEKIAFSRLIPGVLRMSQIFSDHKRLAAGDGFMVEWVPGAGT